MTYLNESSRVHCVKSVQMRSFFWSVFSCIRTEYGDLLCKSVVVAKNEIFNRYFSMILLKFYFNILVEQFWMNLSDPLRKVIKNNKNLIQKSPSFSIYEKATGDDLKIFTLLLFCLFSIFISNILIVILKVDLHSAK